MRGVRVYYRLQAYRVVTDDMENDPYYRGEKEATGETKVYEQTVEAETLYLPDLIALVNKIKTRVE